LVQPLRKSKDIHRAFQEGVRAYSPWAVLHARPRAQEELVSEVRLGIIAGKRFRRSVPRNRARRLLRETARRLLGRRPLPWDLLLVARTEVLDSTFQERLNALREMLRKVGALEETGCPA
jgi:ribonuclease P protein component